MVGVLGGLSSIASGLPIGLAGGAGYGFGIRYGFEKLFPAFTQHGVEGATSQISSDLGELVQNLSSLAGISPGSPLPTPPSAPPKPTSPTGIDPIADITHGGLSPTTVNTPPITDIATKPPGTPAWKFTTSVPLKSKDSGILFQTTVTKANVESTLKSLEGIVNSNGAKPETRNVAADMIQQIRFAHKEHFGYWV